MLPGQLKAQKALKDFERRMGFPVFSVDKHEIQIMKDTPDICKVIRTVNTAEGAKKYGIKWCIKDQEANTENDNENL